MSQSRADRNLSAELFTDRYALIKRFCEYLNEDPPRTSVLFFYGSAGHGKTSLLRHLRNFCKRLSAEQWAYVSKKDPKDFVTHLEQIHFAEIDPGKKSFLSQMRTMKTQAQTVPYAFLNFEENMHDAKSCLVRLRHSVASHKIHLPIFDWAYFQLLKKEGGQPSLKTLFPPEEMDLVTEIAILVLESKWFGPINVLLKLFGKRFQESFTTWRLKRRVDVTEVAEIGEIEHSEYADLIMRLPEIFGRDLNRAVSENPEFKRLVLFFDNYQCVWDAGDLLLTNDAYLAKDEWVRRLILTINGKDGIVMVFAGRHGPRWDEAPGRHKIRKELIDANRVGNLSDQDAKNCLERAEINDAAMQDCLIETARSGIGEVHPLYLALCADTLREARRKGAVSPEQFKLSPGTQDIAEELSMRFMESTTLTLEASIKTLSACRAFNYEIYDRLAKELARDPVTAQKFPLDVREYSVLTTRFSFVLPFGERGGDWFQIHAVLRRIWQRRYEKDMRVVHEVLAKYFETLYRKTENPIWCAEATFHLSQLDPIHGLKEWMRLFRTAVEDESDFSLCEALLGIRDELTVESDFQEAEILHLVAYYRKAFARYKEARELVNAAVQKFDAAEKLTPNDVEIKSTKAEALIALGELQLEAPGRADYLEALHSFERALSSCEQALRLKADHIEANHNKGAAFVSIGDIYSELGEESKAIAHYKQAVEKLDQTIKLNSDHAESYNCKGYALASIAEINGEGDQFIDAIDGFRWAITVYEQALGRDPDDVTCKNNKAHALMGMGKTFTRLRDRENALTAFEQGLTIYNDVLKSSPDDVVVLANKVRCLLALANCEGELGSGTSVVLKHLKAALNTCDKALQCAPNDIEALNAKALTRISFGGFYCMLREKQKAIEAYKEAIAACEQSLCFAEDDLEAHYCRVTTFRRMGELYLAFRQESEAKESLRNGLDECNRVVNIAPADRNLIKEKSKMTELLDSLQ